MPWKRGDDGPRGRGRRTDFWNGLRRLERGVFLTISKAIVPVLFVFFAAFSHAADLAIVAGLAAVGAFVTAAVMLPVDEMRGALKWFRDGGFGNWLYGIYLRLVPGRSKHERRNGRGTLEPARLLVLAVAVCLVASLFATGFAVAATESDDEDDAVEVVHDDYLTDDAYAETFNETQAVESTDRNVRTQIEKTDVFVRLEAENPNSYPVEMTVKIHPDMVRPADVGDVSAADGDTESTWRNTHDFDRDMSYTEVTFRLDANSEVTFAPNRVRVFGVAWKDEATDTDRWLDRLPSLTDEPDLEQRVYEINSSQGAIVTVPLENDGKSIDDWNAVYRTSPDENWKPISTDSSAPAFYRTVDDGESLQLHFDTDDYAPGEVEVEFTANPNTRDTIRHDVRSIRAGLSDMVNFNFDLFMAGPAGVIA
ncbi:hypothetical protein CHINAEXTREME_20510 (plasmid) [Halobiforma lacisalsi AJ5]|uniref:Uncharacterized protein n=1 Tax=Natronobacterium lacisalsi AJ5 TaxID=358396 RepID=A0A1P8LWM0_NATLA|nr:hypothetical protein [Halobiforma lacisalsi]APX00197.1 hypothetical protein CHINAEXTREME_20510 [Halobiforma lacisalsi AJ5]